MDPYDSVPSHPSRAQQQLFGRPYDAFPRRQYHRGAGVAGNGGRRNKPRHVRGNRTGRYDAAVHNVPAGNHVETLVDNTIVNPAFWATVFSALQNNTAVAEEIRRDLEQQESRAARARETRRAQARAESGSDANETRNTGADAEGGEEFEQRPPRPEDLPDLYDAMFRGLGNANRTVGGVQRLDVLIDELQIDALWSARDVTIAFGALTRAVLRLFAGPYATEEENMIVRMMNLGIERASRTFGFDSQRMGGVRDRAQQESIVDTYRRRARVLRDFAAFRYMLEVTERLGRLGRKQKNDLILLYLTLTTPEVRLHRKGTAGDGEQVLAFRDLVTGFAISTPPLFERPMTVEMHLDKVFGNVAINTRLLERSLVAALNNRHRRSTGPTATKEIESLLGSARLLDLSNGGNADATRPVSRTYAIDQKEHAALRHMLETSVTVSMMAEEFRVFVAGAPTSRADVGGPNRANGGDKRSSPSVRVTRQRHPNAMRKPVFFTFKPTSHAVAKKE